MSRFFAASRIALGAAWLLLCLLAWWSGRNGLLSRQTAETQAWWQADEATTPTATADNGAPVAPVEEDQVTAALAEIHRLAQDLWRSGPDLANLIREGQKHRYARSLPIPVLRGVLRRLVDDPTEENGALAYQLAANVLSERDPRAAYDIMRKVAELKLPGVDMDPYNPLAVFAQKAPQAALDYWRQEYQKTPPPEWLKPHQYGSLLGAVALKDFDSAWRAVEAETDPALRRSAMAAMFHGMAAFFAKDRAEWRPEEETRELAQQIIAEAGSEAQRSLKNMLAIRIKHDDPAATLVWFEAMELAPENRAWASQTLAEAWAEKAPADAWTWHVAQAASEQKSAALERAVHQWTGTTNALGNSVEPDLAACSEWLIGQGLGETSQQAMSTLARAYAKQYEPEAALAWARAIPSEEIRQTAEREVATEIKKRFPAEWQQWLPESR